MWLKIFIGSLLAGNAAAGIFLLNSAYKQTKLFRITDEERDSKYPAWRRTDNDKLNSYPVMALLASTVLIPRILMFWICVLMQFFICW